MTGIPQIIWTLNSLVIANLLPFKYKYNLGYVCFGPMLIENLSGPTTDIKIDNYFENTLNSPHVHKAFGAW
jgi:hypothetical protein